MFRVLLTLAACAPAFAQSSADLFSKAPPAVDEALRQRITEFYQHHVEGKYRLAEQLVAEDTKDFFYSSNKPRYVTFEINKIEYSEDFTRAKAIVLCEQYVMAPGFGNKPVKVPTPSTWKMENGQWFWYADQQELRRTPFGVIKPGATGGTPGHPMQPKIPSAGEMGFIFSQVKADKSQVSLKGGATAEVTLSNGAKGVVNLMVPPNNLGLEAKLDRTQLNPGETAVLRVKKSGTAAKAGEVQVRVEPTNQVIPIKVTLE